MADLFRAKAGTLIKSNVQSPGFVSVDGLDGLLRGGKMLGLSLLMQVVWGIVVAIVQEMGKK